MENDYLFEGLTISAAILVASAFIYRYHLMGGFFSTKKVDVGGGMKKDGKYVVSGTSVDKKYPGGDMVVYFGSQTSTAENFSKIIANEGRKSG